MSTIDLHCIRARAGRSDLDLAVRGTRTLPSVPLGHSADMSHIQSWISEQLLKTSKISAATDAELAPIVHRAFAGLPRRVLLDPKFWTWLATGPMRTYAVHRWLPEPEKIGKLQDSVLERFQGGASMVGISRNACSRLYWGAEASRAHTGSYDAVQTIFKRADLFVQIFERKIGLSPMAAVVLSRELCDGTEQNWRNAIRLLNHVLTTTSLELMNDKQVVSLLESLDA